MEVIELANGKRIQADISEIVPEDLKILTKRRFAFDWKACSAIATVYKIQIDGEKDILGVMGLIHFPVEDRIQIKLIAAAIENRGKTKRYDKVIGHLIAYACRMAYSLYGKNCCVSLIPKTNLIKHYMQKYFMKQGGQQLVVEGTSMINLLNEYPI